MLNCLVRLVTGFCLALVLLVIPASAHEGRSIGEYSIVFGWRVEPAYTGLFNGPEFTITVARDHDHDDHDDDEEGAATDDAGTHSNEGLDDHHADAEMVEGAEETLQLEVMFGDQSRVLRVRRVYGQPGHYTADLIPTRPGDYSFRLSGTINGVEIDEVFSSADGEFSTVEPVEDIQFP